MFNPVLFEAKYGITFLFFSTFFFIKYWLDFCLTGYCCPYLQASSIYVYRCLEFNAFALLLQVLLSYSLVWLYNRLSLEFKHAS